MMICVVRSIFYLFVSSMIATEEAAVAPVAVDDDVQDRVRIDSSMEHVYQE